MKKLVYLISLLLIVNLGFCAQPYGTRKSASYEVFTGSDAMGITGACTIYTVLVNSATAGDILKIYDATSATGNPAIEVRVGTNLSSETIDLGANGMAFSTGFYVDVQDSDMYATVVYTE